MKKNIMKFTVELLGSEDIPNTCYLNKESRSNIEALQLKYGLTSFIEPNMFGTGELITIDTVELANKLNPWTESDCYRCDAIMVSNHILFAYDKAIFARSSDCMMISVFSQYYTYIFHASVQSLNSGILSNLPQTATEGAVLGPCISAENYYLYGENYINKMTSNFSSFGYDKFTYYDDKNLHIDIRGIVKNELSRNGIDIIYSDERCTYATKELGSNRRDGKERFDNVMLIYNS